MFKVTIDEEGYLPDREFKDPQGPFVSLLRNLAKLHKTNIHVYITTDWSVRGPAPDQADTLFLYYGCRPPGDQGTTKRPLTRVFGFPVERPANAPYTGPALGRGAEVYDYGDYVPVAQLIGRNAYILVPVFEMYQGVRSEVFSRVMQLIMRDLRKATPWRELANGLNLPPDSESCLKRLASDWHGQKTVDMLLRGLDSRIDSLYRLLAKLHADRKVWIERRKVLQNEADAGLVTDLYNEIAKLKELPDIVDVYARQEGLHIVTDDIVAEHEGKRYGLGKFEMRFSSQYTLHIWALGPTHPNGVPHPHISAWDGSTCFGNVTRTLQQSLGERRLADAARTAIDWLKRGYTEGQTMNSIEEWPEAE